MKKCNLCCKKKKRNKLKYTAIHYDMILKTLVGSAAFRCQLPFNSSRKITKIHQNILVFIKGNAKQAAIRLNKGA